MKLLWRKQGTLCKKKKKKKARRMLRLENPWHLQYNQLLFKSLNSPSFLSKHAKFSMQNTTLKGQGKQILIANILISQVSFRNLTHSNTQIINFKKQLTNLAVFVTLHSTSRLLSSQSASFKPRFTNRKKKIFSSLFTLIITAIELHLLKQTCFAQFKKKRPSQLSGSKD